MSTQRVRAQVMLDLEDHQRLQSKCKEQGKSLSEAIREAVLRYLEDQEQLEQEKFLKTLAEIRQIREKNATRYGVYQGDLVNEARQDRERQLEEAWKQSS